MGQDFKEEWLYRGPSLDEIVSESRDDRRGGQRRLAVIIPSYRDGAVLKAHLERLSKQTCRDFDVIAVYGEGDRFIAAPQASVLHIRRRFDIGSAGAFYAGEKKAIAEGYEYLIMADDDCLPESPHLLESIVESLKDSHVAYPRVSYGGEAARNGWIHHYAGMRREVLERVGFSYLPLYMGGEDVELECRIMAAGFRLSTVRALAAHPMYRPYHLLDGPKAYYYCRGALIQLNLLRGFSVFENIFLVLFSAMILAGLGRQDIARQPLRSVIDAAGLRLFRTGPGPGSAPLAKAEAKDMGRAAIYEMTIPTPREDTHHRGPLAERYISAIQLILRTFKSGLSYFDKDVLGSYPGIMIFARSGKVYHCGEAYELFRGRGLPAIMIGSAATIASIPFIAALSLAFAAKMELDGRMRRVRKAVVGYGLDAWRGSP